MSMWNYLKPADLIAWQRRTTLEQMGREAAELHEQGYAVEADRVLDEMNARKAEWDKQ